MEVVLGAEMLSQLLLDCLYFRLLLVSAPKESEPGLPVRGSLLVFCVFFFKNKHNYNCMFVCVLCIK